MSIIMSARLLLSVHTRLSVRPPKGLAICSPVYLAPLLSRRLFLPSLFHSATILPILTLPSIFFRSWLSLHTRDPYFSFLLLYISTNSTRNIDDRFPLFPSISLCRFVSSFSRLTKYAHTTLGLFPANNLLFFRRIERTQSVHFLVYHDFSYCCTSPVGCRYPISAGNAFSE